MSASISSGMLTGITDALVAKKKMTVARKVVVEKCMMCGIDNLDTGNGH